MKTTVINGTNVYELGDCWSKHTLISLAVNSDDFSIEHEQDADYGRMTIYTLDEGLYAYVREIDEHQIENEVLGDYFGLAFAKTECSDWRGDELETTVRSGGSRRSRKKPRKRFPKPPEDGPMAGAETGEPDRGSQTNSPARWNRAHRQRKDHMFALTVSLAKPVCLAKPVRETRPLANPVCTVSLARPVSLKKDAPKATVSLAKRQTSACSPTYALVNFFGCQDDLHRALGRTDADAARDIAMAMLKMEIAAEEYRYLSGRTRTPRAAIHAAFGSQDINRGHWRLDGSKVLSLVEAMERVQRRIAA